MTTSYLAQPLRQSHSLAIAGLLIRWCLTSGVRDLPARHQLKKSSNSLAIDSAAFFLFLASTTRFSLLRFLISNGIIIMLIVKVIKVTKPAILNSSLSSCQRNYQAIHSLEVVQVQVQVQVLSVDKFHQSSSM